jgi:hypothetical protein
LISGVGNRVLVGHSVQLGTWSAVLWITCCFTDNMLFCAHRKTVEKLGLQELAPCDAARAGTRDSPSCDMSPLIHSHISSRSQEFCICR